MDRVSIFDTTPRDGGRSPGINLNVKRATGRDARAVRFDAGLPRDRGGRFDHGDGRRSTSSRAPKRTRSTRGWYIGFGVDDVERARDELVSRGAKLASDVEGGDAIGSRWCGFYDAEESEGTRRSQRWRQSYVFAITHLLGA